MSFTYIIARDWCQGAHHPAPLGIGAAPDVCVIFATVPRLSLCIECLDTVFDELLEGQIEENSRIERDCAQSDALIEVAQILGLAST